MHGSILVIAKKKAAGPGGYFDPMMEHEGMGSGPMMFEMANEEECCEEPPMHEPMMHGDMGNKDIRDIIADLRAAAQRLEDLHAGAEEEDVTDAPTSEEEPVAEEADLQEDTAEVKAAEKSKAKKPFPGFGPKKEMKY